MSTFTIRSLGAVAVLVGLLLFALFFAFGEDLHPAAAGIMLLLAIAGTCGGGITLKEPHIWQDLSVT